MQSMPLADPRATGAVLSFLLVAGLLLSASPVLGAVVLAGVPAFGLALGPALRPLHGRQAAQRAELGALTGLGADTVSGLRVLRGVGGGSYAALWRSWQSA